MTIRDAQYGPKSPTTQPLPSSIEDTYNSACESADEMRDLALSETDIADLRQCDLSRLDLSPAGLEYLCDQALSAHAYKAIAVDDQSGETWRAQCLKAEAEHAELAQRLNEALASLEAALAAKDLAEAERDAAERLLADRDALDRIAYNAALSATDDLIACRAENARLTAALAGAREECIAAIRVAINGNNPLEPAENDFEEGMLAGLARAVVIIRAHPTTDLAKAEEA